jgi:cell division protein FtsW (lipid II flippase)
MLHEIAGIPDDREALIFAAGCLWAALFERVTFDARRVASAWRSTATKSQEGSIAMEYRENGPNEVRAIGLACAVGATCLGLGYLAAAGAPMHYIVINAVALVLGLVAFSAIRRSGWEAAPWLGPVVLALSAALLATSLFGVSADGASRWLRLGPLAFQTSLIVLPLMIMAFARTRDLGTTAGIVLAAIALALQPDRAMAAVLAASLACLALVAPERRVIGLLALAIIAFAGTLLRPDAPPAVPFVDQIFFSSFDIHPLAGVAVVLGAFLLIVPAIAGWVRDPGRRSSYAVFGVVWLGAVIAAAVGNYPTPVVGYGGSAVLGYVLSLAFLLRPARAAIQEQAERPLEKQTLPDDKRILFASGEGCALTG